MEKGNQSQIEMIVFMRKVTLWQKLMQGDGKGRSLYIRTSIDSTF